jgi:hypothetical protein
MGKKKTTNDQHEQGILEVIKKHKIFSILDIFAFYKGCSRATFYNHGLDELDSIKEAIDDNKIVVKQTLKSKWAKSDNPTLQIALYKSVCTPEERQNLNQSYIDHTSKGEKITMSESERAAEIQRLIDKRNET